MEMSIQKHLLLVASLLFVLFVDLSYSQALPDLCHPLDKKVLLRIKAHLGNPSSLSSWDPTTDCARWNGVQVDGQGHVTYVQIQRGEDIHGPIPPFFDQLPSLTSLSFDHLPNLSGPIPSYIGKLTNLTELSIIETNMTGPIPPVLAHLTNLNLLYLYSNKFTGPIPAFLGRLKKLVNLDLSSNLLTGPIPATLAQLSNVQILELSSNQLFGPIPDFIGKKLKNLIILRLNFNSFSGMIPTNLGSLPKLQTVGLAGNQLSGSIPKSFGRGNLYLIDFSQNKLTGDASFLFEISNTNVLSVEVGYNLLKFDFTKVDLAPDLATLNITHNMIYGSLPKRFSLLEADSIDVSYNQLCGPIPNGRRYKHSMVLFAHNKCLCGGPFPGCK